MTITKFDLAHAPVALYRFDGNVDDSSGNGLHLSPTNAVYRHVWPGVVGLVSGSAQRPLHDTLLEITGDITIEMRLVMRTPPNPSGFIVAHLVGNRLYWVTMNNQTGPTWLSESGAAGVDATFTPTGQVPLLPALGVPFLLTARRAGNLISFWLNGVQFGLSSAPLTPPTGGTTGVLAVHGAATQPEMFGLKIIASALTDAEIKAECDRTIGAEFGFVGPRVDGLWAGALMPDGFTVAARLTRAAGMNARLSCTDTSGTVYSSPVTVVGRDVKLPISGLTADTSYNYQIELDGALIGAVGTLRTAPAAGPASFEVAFAGDANTNSNHAVFDTIHARAPLAFVHLGDMHYDDIKTNNEALFHAGFDKVFGQTLQAALYRDVPTAYTWDDHDYCADNSYAGSPGHDAACSVYRQRVPHYPLADATVTAHVGHAFDIGRVLFLVTDQRSAASHYTVTDDASKTMLGASQKAWFKAQIAAATGKLIVWVCPRLFGGVPMLGAETWGGYSTERAELVDFIHANAPGRVVVLSADMHTLGIDDGSGHDFCTTGSEPLPTFQAAPLDRPTAFPGPSVGLSYSAGHVEQVGCFGTMQITDTGGPTIDVDWRGWNSAGTNLLTHTFTVNL